MHAAGLSWSRTAALMEFGVNILFFFGNMFEPSQVQIMMMTGDLLFKSEPWNCQRRPHLYDHVYFYSSTLYLLLLIYRCFLSGQKIPSDLYQYEIIFCGDMRHCLMISRAVKRLRSLAENHLKFLEIPACPSPSRTFPSTRVMTGN